MLWHNKSHVTRGGRKTTGNELSFLALHVKLIRWIWFGGNDFGVFGTNCAVLRRWICGITDAGFVFYQDHVTYRIYESLGIQLVVYRPKMQNIQKRLNPLKVFADPYFLVSAGIPT